MKSSFILVFNHQIFISVSSLSWKNFKQKDNYLFYFFSFRLIESETKEEEQEAEENVMRVGEEDPFTTKLMTFQQDGVDLSPVVASRSLLKSLGPGEVLHSHIFSDFLHNIFYVCIEHKMFCQTICTYILSDLTLPPPPWLRLWIHQPTPMNSPPSAIVEFCTMRIHNMYLCTNFV